MRTKRDCFSGPQRVLHWLMAIMVLAMLFIGVSMVSTLKPRFLILISIHKPLGIAILALAVLRLGVRLRLGAPALPSDLPRTQALAAKLSHFVLYALLLAMPLVGWGMLSAAAYPVVLFGGWHLPAILPARTAPARHGETPSTLHAEALPTPPAACSRQFGDSPKALREKPRQTPP